jgi:two-component sensor histidine kinase
MDLRGRIGAMALVHQHLYSVGDASALAAPPYVRELGEQVQCAYGREGISLAVDIDDITLCLDTAVPLGLIVGELLANAFQHAFPAGREGVIRIALRALPIGRIRLAVSDDGRGLPGSDQAALDALAAELRGLGPELTIRTGAQGRARPPHR